MAAAARPGAESQGAERRARRPAERALGGQLGGIQPSVLRVSQLVLRAITAHKRLTLTTLRKELGNAGYEVHRQVRGHSREAPMPEGRGAYLRVSSGNSVACFQVWRTPKPKPRRKPGRPRLEEGCSPSRRSPPKLPKPRRRRTHRQAARRAREIWRRSALKTEAQRAKRRARKPVPARARARARRDEASRRASQGDTRPESRGQKRSCSKLREEKQEPKKPGKRTNQRPLVDTSERPRSGPGKARTKTSRESQGSLDAVGSP